MIKSNNITSQRKRQLAAIMFTDIVGFSSMMQNDEEQTIIKVNRHRSVLQKYTTLHKGRILQYYGDASLTIYDSAIEAVQCAIAMQTAYREAPKIPLRIGIHLGEVVFDNEDIYGDAINIANRIESIGIENSILLSEKVQVELKNHPELILKKIGDFTFKNIQEPIGIFALKLDGLSVPDKLHATLETKAVTSQNKDGSLFRKFTIPFLLLALFALGAIAVFRPGFLSSSKYTVSESYQQVTEKRIAVLNFENATGLKELDILGRVSSDWITQGLMETGTAKIITTRAIEQHFDYQQINTNPSEAISDFSKKTGAQSSIEGSFFIQKDSIFFLAKVMNLHTGEVLLSFPPQKSSKDKPLVALEKIKQKICGYWISKEDKSLSILNPPNYDAYKEYLNAQQFWSIDYNKALKHLNRSIALDSSFLLSKFLKISLLQNTGELKEADDLLQQIKNRHPGLNTHYQNYLNFYQYDIRGDNVKAVEAFEKIYNIYKADLFSNTSMAVLYLEYLNQPEQTLQVIQEVNPEDIAYENCHYCLNRMHLQARALIQLKRYQEALEVIRSTSGYEHNRKSRELEIRVLARQNKPEEIRDLLSQIDQTQLDKDFRYLYFNAAREFQLLGQDKWRKEFAAAALDLYLDTRFPKRKKMLSRVYYLKQNYEQAINLIDAKEPSKLSNFTLAQLGAIYAYQRKKEQAEEIITMLGTRKADYGYIAYHQARIYAILQQKEQANSHLQKSLKQGRKFFPYLFTNDPDFKNLLSDKTFQQLMVSQSL